jgi:flagellar motor switch/type III secretory pathway protein FliN
MVAERAPTPGLLRPDIPIALWEEAGWLRCGVSVELTVHNFSVRDLLELAVGSLVESEWKSGEDAPLRVNGWQVGWVEFEQMGESLGVRLTELL